MTGYNLMKVCFVHLRFFNESDRGIVLYYIQYLNEYVTLMKKVTFYARYGNFFN